MEHVWALHGIRLRTADLDLQVMREGDLMLLGDLLPDDVEQDPGATRYAGLDDRTNRRAVLAQSYWRAMGSWSPEHWALPFVVRRDGQVLGAQWLEGPAYRTDHTVDSSSWLVPGARGRGFGRQMRAAVLELAFSHLEAAAAVSSAVVDNWASLGVSRALGYRETHTTVLEHSGVVLQHLRLERSEWARSKHAGAITVAGIRPALPFFGPTERSRRHGRTGRGFGSPSTDPVVCDFGSSAPAAVPG